MAKKKLHDIGLEFPNELGRTGKMCDIKFIYEPYYVGNTTNVIYPTTMDIQFNSVATKQYFGTCVVNINPKSKKVLSINNSIGNINSNNAVYKTQFIKYLNDNDAVSDVIEVADIE